MAQAEEPSDRTTSPPPAAEQRRDEAPPATPLAQQSTVHPLGQALWLLPVLALLPSEAVPQTSGLLSAGSWLALSEWLGLPLNLLPVLTAAAVLAVAWLRCAQQGALLPQRWLPVLLLPLWVGLWITVRYGIGATCGRYLLDSAPWLTEATTSLTGALHEELIFRVGLFLVPAWLLAGLKTPNHTLLLIWAGLSSALFALAHTNILHHHLDAAPFTWPNAIQHGLAGLLYCYIIVRQGLATALWTHAGFNLLIGLDLIPRAMPAW